MSSETTPEQAIARALAAFQAEMPSVHKSKTAKVRTKSGDSYSYSYADLADVTKAVGPVLAKHGLSVTTSTEQGERGWLIVGRLLHEAGGSLAASLPAQFGGGPQQVGSELTYARRYLLGMLTGVVTDDDDDGQAAQHAPRQERAATRPSPRPAQAEKRSPQPPPAGDDWQQPLDGSTPPEPNPTAPSPAQVRKMFAVLRTAGFSGGNEESRDAMLAAVTDIIGREITSSSDMTADEVSQTIDALDDEAAS